MKSVWILVISGLFVSFFSPLSVKAATHEFAVPSPNCVVVNPNQPCVTKVSPSPSGSSNAVTPGSVSPGYPSGSQTISGIPSNNTTSPSPSTTPCSGSTSQASVSSQNSATVHSFARGGKKHFSGRMGFLQQFFLFLWQLLQLIFKQLGISLPNITIPCSSGSNPSPSGTPSHGGTSTAPSSGAGGHGGNTPSSAPSTAVSKAPVPSGSSGSGNTGGSVTVPFDKSTFFNRKDLIYGSEIGAWDENGGNTVNNNVCVSAVKAAKIKVIRWGNWAKFSDMNQGGSSPKQTTAEFQQGINGIISAGAVPFIKLPPIWNQQCDGAEDYWNLAWLEEIVKNAGSKVQLYEFTNEPDNYCNWSSATYITNWENTVPALKAYARSLGWEIYVGGPALANSYIPDNVTYVQDFLTAVKAKYQQTHNMDYIPNFVSSHTYLTTAQDATTASMQPQIDSWGTFYDDVQNAINTTFVGVNDPSGQPIAPQIKIADSEWNFTIDNGSTLANNQTYANYYMNAMFTMLKNSHVWLSDQFTFDSEDGALDMMNADCTAKPLYNAYKTVSTADPNNK